MEFKKEGIIVTVHYYSVEVQFSHSLKRYFVDFGLPLALRGSVPMGEWESADVLRACIKASSEIENIVTTTDALFQYAASDPAKVGLAESPYVTLYPCVPMSIQRVANIERAQMLVESPSRAHLQRFLTAWQVTLHATRQTPLGKGLIRWAIDVDPLAI